MNHPTTSLLPRRQTKKRQTLEQKFYTLHHILENSGSFLLVAHSRPDPDTIGACIALFDHFKKNNKQVAITCSDSLPEEFASVFPGVSFLQPNTPLIKQFDVVIAADSVERGYKKNILPSIDTDRQITILLDHHHDIEISGDLTIIEPKFSSTCELLGAFFLKYSIPISKTMATSLLMGILGDTGNFQHTNTNAHCLNLSSELLKKGAAIQKLNEAIFTNKNLSTLRLWGRALKKARIEKKSKLIVTGITHGDLIDCNATPDDISQVANMLATVPGARCALILTQHEKGVVKGSFRAEPTHNIDVSVIARKLGGGGHALASGFEIAGNLTETEHGWCIA